MNPHRSTRHCLTMPQRRWQRRRTPPLGPSPDPSTPTTSTTAPWGSTHRRCWGTTLSVSLASVCTFLCTHIYVKYAFLNVYKCRSYNLQLCLCCISLCGHSLHCWPPLTHSGFVKMFFFFFIFHELFCIAHVYFGSWYIGWLRHIEWILSTSDLKKESTLLWWCSHRSHFTLYTKTCPSSQASFQRQRNHFCISISRLVMQAYRAEDSLLHKHSAGWITASPRSFFSSSQFHNFFSLMPEHAHESHYCVIVTDMFVATIAAGLSIQAAGGGADRGWRGGVWQPWIFFLTPIVLKHLRSKSPGDYSIAAL